MPPKQRGGDWRRPAGKLIWKLIRGVWTLVGGPTTLKEARTNFNRNSQGGDGRRRKSVTRRKKK